MSLLPKSIHRCRRYPTKFNSGRDIPLFMYGFLYPVILLDPDELDRLHQAFLYREGRRAFVDYIVEKPPFFSFLLAKLTFFLGYDTLWTYRTPFIMTGIAVSVATHVAVTPFSPAERVVHRQNWSTL